MAKLAITHIPIEGGSGNIPTGAMQFENDWPGLFIRGDDCLQLLWELQHMREWIGSNGRTDSPWPALMGGKCEEICRIINEDVIVRRQQE